MQHQCCGWQSGASVRCCFAEAFVCGDPCRSCIFTHVMFGQVHKPLGRAGFVVLASLSSFHLCVWKCFHQSVKLGTRIRTTSPPIQEGRKILMLVPQSVSPKCKFLLVARVLGAFHCDRFSPSTVTTVLWLMWNQNSSLIAMDGYRRTSSF